MMECKQYRRALLADPRVSSPELEQHLALCPHCPAFTQRLLEFEDRLGRALRGASIGDRSAGDLMRVAPAGLVDTPPGDLGAAPAFEPARIADTPPVDFGVATAFELERREGARGQRRAMPRGSSRWLALAASFLGLSVVALSLWLALPHASLAADVVAHMAGEPQAWIRTDRPVPTADLEPVLAASHVKLAPDAGLVSYAQSCLFRGHRVPHLVVQTATGPVTVMVLAHESVQKSEPFDEGGYRGVIVPVAGHGSLAVLMRGGNADSATIGEVTARVEHALVWTG